LKKLLKKTSSYLSFAGSEDGITREGTIANESVFNKNSTKDLMNGILYATICSWWRIILALSFYLKPDFGCERNYLFS